MVGEELKTWLSSPRRRPLIMGVLNVTPDSFSDGGRFAALENAVEHALAMERDGADLIDIGGESTRPGATAIEAAEEIRRIEPVILEIRRKSAHLHLSGYYEMGRCEDRALAGADLVNDISAGLADEKMLSGVAGAGVPVVLMHMQGKPATMQLAPSYSDVTEEVAAFLRQRVAAAEGAGVKRGNIFLDPGIGFGKTGEQSLTLLKNLQRISEIGLPLVVGTSRKSFIGRVLNEADPLKRGFGDAAAISWAVANGAAVLRVHEVKSMGQVVRMTLSIRDGKIAD